MIEEYLQTYDHQFGFKKTTFHGHVHFTVKSVEYIIQRKEVLSIHAFFDAA